MMYDMIFSAMRKLKSTKHLFGDISGLLILADYKVPVPVTAMCAGKYCTGATGAIITILLQNGTIPVLYQKSQR
jgi:hypothetical protein